MGTLAHRLATHRERDVPLRHSCDALLLHWLLWSVQYESWLDHDWTYLCLHRLQRNRCVEICPSLN